MSICICIYAYIYQGFIQALTHLCLLRLVFLQSMLVYCSQDYILKTLVREIIKQPHSNMEKRLKCICIVCTTL